MDRAGLRQQANETIASISRAINYDYDGLRRLTGAITTGTSGATSSGATYDVAGNITRQPESGPTLVPTYDAANQRDPWMYDADGNLLSNGTTSYTYDALNRVTTRATGGMTTTNTYNGDGVLLRQQTGATTTTYTQDLASPLDQILGDGTSTYLYGAERLLAQQGSTGTWYDADALGSVRQTLDASGAPSGSPIWYDPWGNVQSGTPPTFGFTGEVQQGNA